MSEGSEQSATGRLELAIGIEAIRPRDWGKNVVVFAPLIFSRTITDPWKVLTAVAAFAVFCGASGAVYVLNDVCDAEEDRKHPTKAGRPIASGRLSTRNALILAMALAAVSVGGAAFLGRAFLGVVAGYIVLNIVYSLGAKHLVVIDVMMVASGFLLRLLGGAFALRVEPSYWLILCTSLLALFLSFTKRRAELSLPIDAPERVRGVLVHYSATFLDQMIAVVTSASIVCYILYTVDERTVSVFGSRGLLLTTPFVLYGIFRYLYLVYHLKNGGNPAKAVFSDLPMVINLALWAVSCIVITRYGSTFCSLLD